MEIEEVINIAQDYFEKKVKPAYQDNHHIICKTQVANLEAFLTSHQHLLIEHHSGLNLLAVTYTLTEKYRLDENLPSEYIEDLDSAIKKLRLYVQNEKKLV